MTQVLYLNASPRGAVSAGTQAAEVFLKALDDSIEVNQINLFERELPDVTLEVTSAKMKNVFAMDLEDEEARQWRAITEVVNEFLAADHYLFAIPMWNFGVPYKLKHYINTINHPGLTFTIDENGHRGLVSGSATVIYVRGGDYSPKDGQPDALDFQSTYVKAWLTSVGITDINEILIQNTIGGQPAIDIAIDLAADDLKTSASMVSLA